MMRNLVLLVLFFECFVDLACAGPYPTTHRIVWLESTLSPVQQAAVVSAADAWVTHTAASPNPFTYELREASLDSPGANDIVVSSIAKGQEFLNDPTILGDTTPDDDGFSIALAYSDGDPVRSITHEFGHTLGLAHRSDVPSIMCPVFGESSCNTESIQQVDVDAYNQFWTSDNAGESSHDMAFQEVLDAR